MLLAPVSCAFAVLIILGAGLRGHPMLPPMLHVPSEAGVGLRGSWDACEAECWGVALGWTVLLFWG